jgi:hypothetical protein
MAQRKTPKPSVAPTHAATALLPGAAVHSEPDAAAVGQDGAANPPGLGEPGGFLSAADAGNKPATGSLRITSTLEGFRRAGVAHSRQPQVFPVGSFSPEQIEALLAEPLLSVELL